MIKGKFQTVFLLGINILIWGYLGNKVLGIFDEEKEIPSPRENAIGARDENLHNNYILNLKYPDPFLKTEERRKKKAYAGNKITEVAENTRRKVPVSEPAAFDTLPVIKYLGLAANKINGAVTALLIINGESKLVKAKESVGDLIVSGMHRDSIVLRKGRRAVVIKRVAEGG